MAVPSGEDPPGSPLTVPLAAVHQPVLHQIRFRRQEDLPVVLSARRLVHEERVVVGHVVDSFVKRPYGET